jgi:hypothetical protein
MKRFLILFASFAVIFYISVSCNNQKTIQDYLREEKKAIDRYISKNNIVVLEKYPANHVFKANEYFKTNEGLYIHVVDSGGRKVLPVDEVTVRFDSIYYLKDTTKIAWSDTYSLYPYTFTYGLSNTYSPMSSPVCIGWVIPLSFVGENGVVDLIIPSSIGSYSDSNSFTPLVYRKLTYTNFY